MGHSLTFRAKLGLLSCVPAFVACNTNATPPEARREATQATSAPSATPSTAPGPSGAQSPGAQSPRFGTMPSTQTAAPVNVIAIPSRAGTPRYLLVLLHGVGDNAAGFQGVGRHLAQGLPEVDVLVPDGFHPFDGGGDGRQWFSRVGITESNRAERVRAAGTEVSSWIDGELRQRGLSPERLLVGGFSQGAMVSGWLALHRQPSPRAVVMLSGRLSEDDSLPAPRVATPVFLGHGADDHVIPISFLAPAAQGLASRGAKVTERVYPGLAHQISRQELSDVDAFLQGALGGTQQPRVTPE